MNNVARSSVLNMIAGLSTMIGGFVSTVLVARILGVEGTGIVAYAIWVITTALIVVDLGISGTLSRYLPEIRNNGEADVSAPFIRYFFFRHLAVVSIALFFACMFALWLSIREPQPSDTLIDRPVFWLTVALATFVQGLAAVNGGILRGIENFGRLAFVSLIGGVLQITASLLGGLWFGPLGAMWAAILGYVVGAFSLASYISRTGTLPPVLKKRANSFAFETWLAYLVTAFAWSRMEIFFLERSWGSDAAGIFGIGLTLANMAIQAPLLLAGPLTPYISRHSSKERAGKAHEAYGVGMRILAFIVLPSCLSVVAVAPELLPFVFGQDFKPAVPVLMVLMVGSAVSAVASVANIYLYAMERPRVITLVGGFAATTTILVGLWLVPAYGPIAAAAGRSGTQLVAGVFILLYTRYVLKCPTPFGSVAACFVASCCAAMVAFLISHGLGGMKGVLAGISLAVPVYFATVFLLCPLRERDIQFLHSTVETMVPAIIRTPVLSSLELYRRRIAIRLG